MADKSKSKAPTPLLSVSGTNVGELVKQKTDLRHVLMIAVAGLNKSAPHGRDYQGRPEDYQKALKVNKERIDILINMAEELESEATDILDAI